MKAGFVAMSLLCLSMFGWAQDPQMPHEGGMPAKPAGEKREDKMLADPDSVFDAKGSHGGMGGDHEAMLREPHEFNASIPTNVLGSTIMLSFDSASTGGEVEFQVYAVGDAASAKQILLIHEFWGLNMHIKALADQFAAMGYRSYAIDLYGGSVAQDRAEAAKLMESANKEPKLMLEKLDRVVKQGGIENPNAKFATIGWCFGGAMSIRTAIQAGPDVDACIIYYGRLPDDAADVANLTAPVLCILADRDKSISPEMGATFAAAMKEAGKSLELKSYPADHAFANPSGQRFQEKEAREAWDLTMEFLKKHIEPPVVERSEDAPPHAVNEAGK